MSRAITGIILVLVCAGSGWWLFDRIINVYVYDARITTDLYALGANVSGRLAEVYVNSGDKVQKGQKLALVDNSQATKNHEKLQLGLRSAELELATLEKSFQHNAQLRQERIVQAKHQLEQAKSTRVRLQAEVKLAKAEYDRIKSLYEDGFISDSELHKAESIYEASRAELDEQEHGINDKQSDLNLLQAEQNLSAIEELEIEKFQSDIDSLKSELQAAAIHLADHEVSSPVDGVVSHVFGLVGEGVLPGQDIFIVYDPQDVWVSANLRETDLSEAWVGKEVMVRIDAYNNREVMGKIARIYDTTTAQSSLLPNTNPGGNFTKITQRVEIKISLDDAENLDIDLKPGLMVVVVLPSD